MSTRGKELGSSENTFRNLRRTERQVSEIPEMLKQVFQPHLLLIQSTRNFMSEGNRSLPVGDIMHSVRKYRSGDRDAFTFYSEFSDAEGIQERRTVDLRTDRNYVGIETVDVNSLKVNDEEETIGKILTTVDLSNGVRIEQQAEPIPGELKGQAHNKQTFIFNTRDTTLARLTWSKDKEEHSIVTIRATEEIISLDLDQISTDFRTGERVIKGRVGTFRIPPPDLFIAEAIRKVVNLEPLSFFSIALF